MSSNSSTGQILGYVVGAVVGYLSFGTSYVLMGAMVGGAIGGAIDPPKGPKISGPRLSDLSQQGASYGTPIPRIYGSVATYGNVFWIENNALKESSKTSGGGKGGGGGAETTTYSYSATFALGLCEGPIAGIRRIWISGKLFYDAGAGDIETIIASNEAAGSFTLHRGESTQQPDARMQATIGVANTPAYRGLAYLVFHDLELADYGNTLMGAQIKVEVVQDESISVPVHQSTISYVGEVTYFGDGYFQTAVANQGRFDLTANLYYASCTFREYDFFGNLISVSTLEQPCQKSSGNTSFTYHKTIFIRGELTSFMAVVNDEWRITDYRSGKTLYIGIEISGLSSGRAFTFAGGSYWIPCPSSVLKIASDFESFSSHVISGANHQSIIVREDVSTGRLFAKYELMASGHYLAEFVTSPDAALWTHLFGVGLVHGSAYNNFFDCYNSRLMVSDAVIPSGHMTVYQIESSSLTLLGSLSGNTGGLNKTSSIGMGFMLNGGLMYRVTDAPSFADSTTLADIVEAEVERSSLVQASDVDVSSLSDTVRGFRIAGNGAIRGNLEILQGAYPFDVVPSGYVIRFSRRSGLASVATVSIDDLGTRPASDKMEPALTRTREMDSQLPVRVIISHLDIAREYDVSEQYAERLNTSAINEQRVELAIVMDADEAAQVAETLLYMYWLERYEFSFTLPPSLKAIEPGDVITINAYADQFAVRLTSAHSLPDGRIECSGRPHDAVYVSNASGVSGGASSGTIAIPGRTEIILLDIPAVVDDLDSPGFLVAASGVLSGWPGGLVYRSIDAGMTWQNVLAFTSPSTIGYVPDAVAAPTDYRMFDKATVIGARFFGAASVSSVSELQVLNGYNYFAFGMPGRWEIIGVQSAVLQGDGSYVLTDLLRGRFGTEWAASMHQMNDKLVLLDRTQLQVSAANLNSIGLAHQYRGVSLGKDISTAPPVDFTYAGQNLECLSPVYLNGSRHPATNDWSLSWLRRSRVGAEWRDLVDASLGEASEAYEVEIYGSNTYATIKRTISSLSSAACLYSSANQIADFGSNQSTLYVKIYQLSANVGRGQPLITSITR